MRLSHNQTFYKSDTYSGYKAIEHKVFGQSKTEALKHVAAEDFVGF